ncbi:hypothetical protein Q5P01_003553 [Channa striata]|uniref:C-type lectin domain-containing protein n=1 Tax=Channa striata TaxID=64152 RepID=A0AA88NG64_CHASR|nr:hypothetical protein Q5P01_003553 [Channa striata]
MTPVFIMLCSEFFHFTLTANRLRFFTLSEEVQWQNGLNICTELNETLVTLYDQKDANFTDSFLSNIVETGAWLGLHMDRHNVSTWSDGAPFTFNLSHVNITNGEQICEAIVNNRWEGFNCSERKHFMCHKDHNYFLINEAKDWCQAHHYCRKHHSDLVSIRNDTQNQQVIGKGNGATFWIGLMHDGWKWVDNSCSTYRRWHNINGKANAHCSVRIIVIQNNLTWEQAFDHCKAEHTRLLQIEDENDQKAVEQWLNNTSVAGKLWIGLRQSRVFGFWIWSDKTVNYSNWRNNEMPEMPLSNHCGVISRDGYTWSDENCLLQLPFICEEDIVYMGK